MSSHTRSCPSTLRPAPSSSLPAQETETPSAMLILHLSHSSQLHHAPCDHFHRHSRRPQATLLQQLTAPPTVVLRSTRLPPRLALPVWIASQGRRSSCRLQFTSHCVGPTATSGQSSPTCLQPIGRSRHPARSVRHHRPEHRSPPCSTICCPEQHCSTRRA